MATPRASPVWRIMLTTPEPVAKEGGGSDVDAVAMSVGRRQTHTDPGQDHPGEDARQIIGVHADSQGPPRLASPEDEAARRDHGCRAVPGDEPTSQQKRHHRHHDWPRRNSQPGSQRRPAPYALFPQDEREQHGAERDGKEQGDQGRPGEAAGAEQVRMHERCPTSQAVQYEQPDEQYRTDQASRRFAVRSSPSRSPLPAQR